MPTVVTKTIKPAGGGDYTSLQSANDALDADIVAADQQIDLICYSGGNLGALNMGVVWVTDATRFVRITVAAGERHEGIYTTAKAYISSSASSGIIKNQPTATVVEFLQIEQTGDDNNHMACLVPPGIAKFTMRGCLCKTAPSSTTFWGGATSAVDFQTDITGDRFFYNNILYGWNVKTGNNGLRTNNHTSGKTYAYNNTLVDCDVGLLDGFSDIVAKNNLVSGGTTCFSGSHSASSEYNASSDATAVGTNSRTSQTFTFVDAAGKNYHLAATDAGARGFGKDLSGDANLVVTDDIDRVTRSVPWDIGADEVAVLGGVPSEDAGWAPVSQSRSQEVAFW